MATKRSNENQEPEEIGKPHQVAGERARDEQREGGGPRYGGEAWEVADERGDRRFGVARNDDSDPSELAKGEGAVDDDGWPGDDSNPEVQARTTATSDIEDNGAGESGGQQAGFGRGEEPRKPKARTKPNPHGAKR